MKARDIMTKDVVTAHPGMSVKEAAKLMIQKGISGLPVVAKSGNVVGILSEADLMHRTELGEDGSRLTWADYFVHSQDMAERFTKAHASKVHDVMARPVVSIDADAELADVADTLEDRGVKRLPVMDGDTLVGIITRRDLVKAYSRSVTKSPASKSGGAALRSVIEQKMKALPWLDISYLNMSVLDGVVRVRGYAQSKKHEDALRVLIEETPGVVAVEMSVTAGLPALNWDGQFT